MSYLKHAVSLAAAPALLSLAVALMPSPAPQAHDEDWLVAFEAIFVPPVRRDDVTQLVDAGTIETDGFTRLIFSFGGEFKSAVPREGRVGVILLPDADLVDAMLRNEGEFIFPLEVQAPIQELRSAIFIAEQQEAKVAFGRYRVYMYNETSSGAKVWLYVYRTPR